LSSWRGGSEKAEGESSLKAERPRKASGEGCAVLATLFAMFLASCTTADPTMQMTSPDYNMTGTDSAADSTEGSGLTMSADSDTALPQQVGYLPVVKPGMITAAAAQTGDAAGPTKAAMTAETAAQPPATQQPATERQAAAGQQSPATKPATETAAADASQAPKADQDATTAAIPVPTPKDASNDKNQVIVTATDPAATAPIEPKKRGFLSAFFGSSPASAAPAKKPAAFTQLASAAPEKPDAREKPEKAKPLVQLASASEEDKPLAVRASLNRGDLDPLPGVRQTALFEIKRKSGIDDDSDVDLHEDEDWGPVNVATAGGLARLAPNGLIKQTDNVDVACLKPSLVRVLKTVEDHYAKKLVVTSGYRSPAHNRRARGAKNSLHMYCAAADIQVPGVSKWELATYFRTMPGRGGVGTYCHTESVHIDVGPERDWNWRCRRRKA
jgi:uncharacterized protein YcbK (DUF882 family)